MTLIRMPAVVVLWFAIACSSSTAARDAGSTLDATAGGAGGTSGEGGAGAHDASQVGGSGGSGGDTAVDAGRDAAVVDASDADAGDAGDAGETFFLCSIEEGEDPNEPCASGESDPACPSGFPQVGDACQPSGGFSSYSCYYCNVEPDGNAGLEVRRFICWNGHYMVGSWGCGAN